MSTTHRDSPYSKKYVQMKETIVLFDNDLFVRSKKWFPTAPIDRYHVKTAITFLYPKEKIFSVHLTSSQLTGVKNSNKKSYNKISHLPKIDKGAPYRTGLAIDRKIGARRHDAGDKTPT